MSYFFRGCLPRRYSVHSVQIYFYIVPEILCICSCKYYQVFSWLFFPLFCCGSRNITKDFEILPPDVLSDHPDIPDLHFEFVGVLLPGLVFLYFSVNLHWLLHPAMLCFLKHSRSFSVKHLHSPYFSYPFLFHVKHFLFHTFYLM